MIIPCLTYRDLPGAIERLGRAFGLTTLSASAQHVELALGDGVLMLGPARDDASVPNDHQSIYLVVADADAMHERARTAGFFMVRPLGDTPYGSREFSARDHEGHVWHVGTYVPTRSAG